MKVMRAIVWAFVGTTMLLVGSSSFAQVVINEMVDDQRSSGSGQTQPDGREFLELYNGGESEVNIAGWTLNVIEIGLDYEGKTPATYTIPNGMTIGAGGYFVIGHPSVSGVNFTPTGGFNGELFPDDVPNVDPTHQPNSNFIVELRNPANDNELVDALATETFRDPELGNLTSEQLAQVGNGYWAQTLSMNPGSLNPAPQSFARWRDGLDRNSNGRDFGFMPLTPGSTNNILPENSIHTIPDVDGMVAETALGNEYYASFVLPRVVDPQNQDGTVSLENFQPSPQGGNAIMAYDESGGGSTAYSKELVNAFDLWAYIETDSLGELNANEATTYGIGTSDPFFGSPNSTGLLTLTSTQNGNTGVGWLIQRAQADFGGGVESRTILQLVNFGQGGDSVAEDNDWDVVAEYDLSGEESGWRRLSIEYDEETGLVNGGVDGDFTEFAYDAAGLDGDFNEDGTVDAADYVIWRKNGGTPEEYDAWAANFGESGGGEGGAELFGTFYAGYREGFTGGPSLWRPPTYDMIEVLVEGGGAGVVPEPSSLALVMLGMFAVAVRRRRS
jgi:Lamin Tail Domain/PEP-CTERM motif